MTQAGLLTAGHLPPSSRPAKAGSGGLVPGPRPPEVHGAPARGSGVCLQTRSGAAVVVASQQPLLVVDEAGILAWRPAREVRVGDHLGMDLGRTLKAWSQLPPVEARPAPVLERSRIHPRFPSVLDEDLARLAGLYVGNGSLPRRSVSIAVCADDPDVASWLRNYWRQLGMRPSFSSARHCITVRACAVEAVAWFVANDLHKQGATPGSASAHIPEGILRSPLPVLEAFLAGYFTADGSAHLGSSETVKVTATTVSPRLALEVSTALRHAGIRNHVRCYPPRGALARLPLYHIRLADVRSADLFAKRIGFCCKRKQAVLQKARLSEEKFQSRRHSLHHPVLLDDLFRHALDLDRAVGRKIASNRSKGSCNIGWAIRLMKAHPPLWGSKLGKLLLLEGVDYVAVSSITPLPEQDWISLTTATGEPVFANAFAAATQRTD